VINRVDNRMIILFGFLLTACMWQIDQFRADGHGSGDNFRCCRVSGLGCTFVPLNIIALSNCAPHPDPGHGNPQRAAHLGGSIGISVLVATLARTPGGSLASGRGSAAGQSLAQAPYLRRRSA